MVHHSTATSRKALASPELVAVIAVIGILSLVAGANYYERQARSRYGRALADLAFQRRAVEAYAADHAGEFPRMSWGGTPFSDRYEGTYLGYTLTKDITTPVAYLEKLMEDPNVGPGPEQNYSSTRLYAYESADFDAYMNAVGVGDYPVLGLPGFMHIHAGGSGIRKLRAYLGAYVLWGSGPAGVVGNTNTSGTEGTFYMQYDPTNGTRSAGNIFISQRHPSPVYIPPDIFFARTVRAE